jgi:hypothetical protein
MKKIPFIITGKMDCFEILKKSFWKLSVSVRKNFLQFPSSLRKNLVFSKKNL